MTIEGAELSQNTRPSILERSNIDILNKILSYLIDPQNFFPLLNKSLKHRFIELNRLRFFRGATFDMPEIADINLNEPEIQNILTLRRIDDNGLVSRILLNLINRKSCSRLSVPICFFLSRNDLVTNNLVGNIIDRDFCDIFDADDNCIHSHIPLPTLLKLKNHEYLKLIFSTPHLIRYYTNQVSHSRLEIKEGWVGLCIINQVPFDVFEGFLLEINLFRAINIIIYCDCPSSDHEYLYTHLNALIDKYSVVDSDYLKRLIMVRFGEAYDEYFLFDDNNFAVSQNELKTYMFLASKSNKINFLCKLFFNREIEFQSIIRSSIFCQNQNHLKLIFDSFSVVFGEDQKSELLKMPEFLSLIISNFSFSDIQIGDGNEIIRIIFVPTLKHLKLGFSQASIQVALNLNNSRNNDLFVEFLEKMWQTLAEEKVDVEKFEVFIKIYFRFIIHTDNGNVIKADYHIFKLLLESDHLRNVFQSQQRFKLSIYGQEGLSNLFDHSILVLKEIIAPSNVYIHVRSLAFLFTTNQFANFEEITGKSVSELILLVNCPTWNKKEYSELHQALKYWLNGPDSKSIWLLKSEYFLRTLQIEFPQEMRQI